MLLSITSRADGYLQFITVLLLFIFVLVITWFTTRWIANYQKGKGGVGNIEVVETCKVTPNKYIQIVRAGNKYLVIAIGKDEIHMLAELSGEELILTGEQAEQTMDFGSILNKLKKQNGKEKN